MKMIKLMLNQYYDNEIAFLVGILCLPQNPLEKTSNQKLKAHMN